MSKSASAVLKIEPFILMVQEAIEKDTERTKFVGLVSESGVPEPGNPDSRRMEFYLDNQKVQSLGETRTLLFCTEVRAYLQTGQYGILIKEAWPLGTVDEPQGSKKAIRIDKLVLNADDFIDASIPPWQIPPKV